MTPEYITKDALKETLIDWSCDASYIEVETKWALEEIKNIPAADVAPVIHGKWIRKRTVEHEGEWYCSICGKDMLYTWGPGCGLADYCPHCGARMDSEQNG